MGKLKGVAETESLNVPILISTSGAGKNVPRSPGPFIKVMKSRLAHDESDSPVCCALHRDSHGHMLVYLDCSYATVTCGEETRLRDCGTISDHRWVLGTK